MSDVHYHFPRKAASSRRPFFTQSLQSGSGGTAKGRIEVDFFTFFVFATLAILVALAIYARHEERAQAKILHPRQVQVP